MLCSLFYLFLLSKKILRLRETERAQFGDLGFTKVELRVGPTERDMYYGVETSSPRGHNEKIF